MGSTEIQLTKTRVISSGNSEKQGAEQDSHSHSGKEKVPNEEQNERMSMVRREQVTFCVLAAIN